ncbi:AP2 domain-containing protein [Clostridium botulinum]|nr:AP2 domain-containing protein [Clostridium botulinum]NFO92498.1 AP2 domain-containing protein [Clostridium botulinum]
MWKLKDLTGKRFGYLIVCEKNGLHTSPSGQKKQLWKCKCDCGKETLVISENLRNGNTRSCGCLSSEIASRNGEKNKKNLLKDRFKDTRIGCISSNRINKNNTSGVKGVYLDRRRNKWFASIGFKGKTIFLGYADSQEDANKLRKDGEEKYFKPILEEFKNK